MTLEHRARIPPSTGRIVIQSHQEGKMPIPTPTPPTDNLYKFLAIAGLVVFVAVPFYEKTHSREVSERMDRVLSRLQHQVREFQYVKDDQDLLLQDSRDVGKTTAHTIEAVTKAYESLRRRGDEIEERRRSLEKEKLDIEVERRAIEALRSDTAFWQPELRIARYGGALCMFLGFYWWYWRVQVYQDKMLKAAALGSPATPAGKVPAEATADAPREG